MTPQEIDDFLNWVIDNYGLSAATQIAFDGNRDPDVFINHPYYQEFLASQGLGEQFPREAVPPQERAGVEDPRFASPQVTLVAELVPQDWGDFGGVFEWSDGTFTNAYNNNIPEGTARALEAYYIQGISFEEVPPQIIQSLGTVEYDASGLPIWVVRDSEGEIISQAPLSPSFFTDDPTVGDFVIQSEGGWDIITYLDENGQPIGEPQVIGRTEDRGMDEYEAALIDIQNQRLGLEEQQLGLQQQQLEQQQFEFGNLSAWQQAQLQMMMLPWEQLTAEQKAQFAFDREIFEQQKRQWQLEFERQQFEFENLSAWQESQEMLGLRQLGLQERIAQTEIQKRPMDWLAAWQFSNPTWSGQPRGTPNPQAQPFVPIPEGGFPPSPIGGR